MKKWGVLFFCAISLILFSRIVARDMSHDEYQFISSGVLFSQGFKIPYIDYPFLHMPYMPIINGLLLAPFDYKLLATRMLDGIVYLLSSIVLFRISNYLLRDLKPFTRYFIGFASISIFLLDPSYLTMRGYALNHAIPVLMSLLCIYMAMIPNSRISNPNFIIGAASGIATGIRLNYLVLFLSLCIYCLVVQNHSRKEKVKRLLMLSLGFITALIPCIIIFLASPEKFIYGNITYIFLNNAYRVNLGHSVAMDIGTKMSYFLELTGDSITTSFLYISYIILILIIILNIKKHLWTDFLNNAILCSILGAFLLVTSYMPTPSWPQYFFAPVPILIVCMTLLLSIIQTKSLITQKIIMIFLGFILLINPGLKVTVSDLTIMSKMDNWIPIRFHKFSEEVFRIAGCDPNDPKECKILTLASVVPLESGADIYPFTAVGPFSWRTAGLMLESNRIELELISPKELPLILDNDNPNGILVGFETGYAGFDISDKFGLEYPFIKWAIENQYYPITIADYNSNSDRNIALYVKKNKDPFMQRSGQILR